MCSVGPCVSANGRLLGFKRYEDSCIQYFGELPSKTIYKYWTNM